MAVIAAATETLRIGTFVANNDLRHPAILAQDLATLDVLSGGRLDIGIGAGWNRPEYDAHRPAIRRRSATRVVAAGRVGGGAQGLLRRRPVLVPWASTTRSPTTTASRSRSSGRIRRC